MVKRNICFSKNTLTLKNISDQIHNYGLEEVQRI